jgi:hypothetical protein
MNAKQMEPQFRLTPKFWSSVLDLIDQCTRPVSESNTFVFARREKKFVSVDNNPSSFIAVPDEFFRFYRDNHVIRFDGQCPVGSIASYLWGRCSCWMSASNGICKHVLTLHLVFGGSVWREHVAESVWELSIRAQREDLAGLDLGLIGELPGDLLVDVDSDVEIIL